uniref:Transposase n=1 Tax=Mesocestoides corti TaxID=53468 RepID=A0A5K3FB08_MESCO
MQQHTLVDAPFKTLDNGCELVDELIHTPHIFLVVAVIRRQDQQYKKNRFSRAKYWSTPSRGERARTHARTRAKPTGHLGALMALAVPQLRDTKHVRFQTEGIDAAPRPF